MGALTRDVLTTASNQKLRTELSLGCSGGLCGYDGGPVGYFVGADATHTC